MGGRWVVHDQSHNHVLVLLSLTQELLHRSPLWHPAWAGSIRHRPALRDHLMDVPPPPGSGVGETEGQAPPPQIQPLPSPRGSASQWSLWTGRSHTGLTFQPAPCNAPPPQNAGLGAWQGLPLHQSSSRGRPGAMAEGRPGTPPPPTGPMQIQPLGLPSWAAPAGDWGSYSHPGLCCRPSCRSGTSDLGHMQDG